MEIEETEAYVDWWFKNHQDKVDGLRERLRDEGDMLLPYMRVIPEKWPDCLEDFLKVALKTALKDEARVRFQKDTGMDLDAEPDPAYEDLIIGIWFDWVAKTIYTGGNDEVEQRRASDDNHASEQ